MVEILNPNTFLDDLDTDVGLYAKPKEEGEALTIDDLETNTAYLEPIRKYMVDRKGKQFLTKTPEEVIDAFTRHMRFFNTNEAVTISEALYMNKADPLKRSRAGEAYKIFDQLGNVFVNDGLYGAVDGVYDYITSIALSPSTYVGFGIGKGVSALTSKAAVAQVKKQAQRAYMKSFREGGKEAAQKAFNDVVQKSLHSTRLKTAAGTGVVDGAFAVDQDIRLQDTEMKAGSRDRYNPDQTVLSGVASLAASSFAIANLPKTKVKTDKDGMYKRLRRAANKTNEGVRITATQRKKFTKKYFEALEKTYGERDGGLVFQELAAEGERIFAKNALEKQASDLEGRGVVSIDETGNVFVQKAKQPATPFRANLVTQIIGNKKDGTYIIDLAKESGYKFPSSLTKGDQLGIILSSLDQDDAVKLNELMLKHTGFTFGNIHDNLAPRIASTVARSIQDSAQTLVAVQGKKLREDLAYLQGTVAQKIADEQALPRDYVEEVLETLAEEKRTGSPVSLAYAQNLWKRMLVSAPQTTAVNVYGWGQWYTANTIAEVLQSGMYGVMGLAKGGRLTEAGRQDFALSKAMFDLQKEKFKNLVDPYTTYQSYMQIINSDPKLKKKLFDTFSGGVDRTAERFNIDEANKIFRTFESVAEGAAQVSLVKAQDSITKSQIFMNSLDKQLRLQKGMTFSEAIAKGDFSELSEEVVDKALEETMKSVFSFDYTKQLKDINIFDKPGQLGRELARIVESVSGNPIGGFILPFGRFMNNVVAFSYAWGPTGLFPVMAAMNRKGALRPDKIELAEALSRATVGTTALILAMDFQKKQEAKGLAFNEIETGGGDVVDIGNTFPMSLLMAGARYFNTLQAGADSKEIRAEFLKQMAIGQTAKDLSFGNDLTKMFAFLERGLMEGDSGAGQYATYLLNQGSGTLLGNIGSGYTRFLDPVNRIVGYMSDTDPGIDRRLADSFGGALSLNGLKYTDNIFEGLTRLVSGDEDYLMGEKAQVASREGDLYDPSPMQTSMGIRVKQPRTATEIMFGMVGKPNWKASIYTGVPKHDNYVNRVISPILEREAEDLLKRKGFQRASLADKQEYVKAALKRAKTIVRDDLSVVPLTKEGLNYRRVKIDRTISDIKLTQYRKQLGIQNKLKDMTDFELSKLEAHIKEVRDKFKGMPSYE